ncbi:unnamed protein product [Rhizophagus irregularis]|uniref:BTB domain-containing protein n=1 Tax=Rhizophagus irregularis TaxID=588596 RepID=A0A916E730_9GLOM|nr:unnamed protein product [Rhizophagus irregularis]
MVLKYIYTGELELKKYPGEIILGLLVASDELLLGELFEHVQDYLIEEIDVWDSLIKWGIEQTPGLGSMNSNRIKWSNINYEALKKTLDSFIPLIRNRRILF